jgi:hypothetical protein
MMRPRAWASDAGPPTREPANLRTPAQRLENATDRAEDAAHTLEGDVLKHA